jgi:hypothetical protein
MKKLLITAVLAISLSASLAGCSADEIPTEPPASESTLPKTEEAETVSASESSESADTVSETDSAIPNTEIWQSMSGSYVWLESSQFNNAVLNIKYLDNDCLLFEFRLMEGSETEDSAKDLTVAGVMAVDEAGVGRYEGDPGAENSFAVVFEISENGQQISVTYTGEMEISPDGAYEFSDAGFAVSAASVTPLLEFLPTAATSLNSSIGAYTIDCAEEPDTDGFYTAEAVFDDTGATLAKFLVAEDLSEVFRADDDIEPVIIFGF